MNKRKLTICMFLFFMACAETHAQNSFSVSNKNSHYMNLNADNYEGASQKTTYQYSEWINYTTLVDQYEPASFSITVQMVSANKPKGLEFMIEAAPYQGISKGAVGTPTGLKAVDRGARVLIDNITTCFTGSERGEGHHTVLRFSAPLYNRVDSTSYRVSIVYTLLQ